jgi:serine protease AprX
MEPNGLARSSGLRQCRVGAALTLAAVTFGALFLAPKPVAHDDRHDAVVLVSTLPGAVGTAEHAVRNVGGAVLKRLSIIDGFEARVPTTAVSALRTAAGVRWVSPDRTVLLEGMYGAASGVASAVYPDVVLASRDWASGVTGAGVTVAVVDTGVNQSGDLGGQVVHQEDFTAEQDGNDNYGHGTFVAGLIAGTGAGSNGAVKGVAPGAKLVSLKIAGRDGSTDVTRVLEALEWIVDYRDVYGIRVVNLSIGFQTSQSYLVDPLDFAVERVWNNGIVVVTAAGNGNNQPRSITAPGNDPFVITVGASDDKTTTSLADDSLATFSSLGPTANGFSKPDFLAPGKSVVSSRSPGSLIDTTYPTSEVGTVYTRGSGTSFSTAIASGVAALVIQHNPSLSPNQVKARMVDSTRPLGTLLYQLLHPGMLGDLDAYSAAFSIGTTSANQGVAPASGGGSLQVTRGPTCLVYASGTCMTDTDANTALGFNPAAYFSNQWAGNVWLGSRWLSCNCTSPWNGAQWGSSQWVTTGQAAVDWANSQWVGSQWVGSQWVGSQWVGSQWVDDAGGTSSSSTYSGGLLSGLLGLVPVLAPTTSDVWGWLP